MKKVALIPLLLVLVACNGNGNKLLTSLEKDHLLGDVKSIEEELNGLTLVRYYSEGGYLDSIIAGDQKTVYVTDEDGWVSEEIHTMPNQQIKRTYENFPEEKKATFISEDGLTTGEVKFDVDGKIMSNSFKSDEGEVTVEREYNEDYLVKSTTTFTTPVQETIYTVEYEYDSDGNPLKLTTTNRLGEQTFSNYVLYSNYEFDDNGNWIKRKVEAEGQAKNETRLITYY